jgi:hypothetical protein
MLADVAGLAEFSVPFAGGRFGVVDAGLSATYRRFAGALKSGMALRSPARERLRWAACGTRTEDG